MLQSLDIVANFKQALGLPIYEPRREDDVFHNVVAHNQVLDNTADKIFEKCRKVTDAVELLSYPLSHGNRWLPASARDLLEKELEARNAKGREALRSAVGLVISAEWLAQLETLVQQLEAPVAETRAAASLPWWR